MKPIMCLDLGSASDKEDGAQQPISDLVPGIARTTPRPGKIPEARVPN